VSDKDALRREPEGVEAGPTPVEMVRDGILEHFTSTLDAALVYARLGWPVFPLHWPVNDAGECSCGDSECERVGKHPLTRHGLHDATTDEKRISDWFAKYPDANIGGRTGTPDGFDAIDIDSFESWRELTAAHAEIETLASATGKGEHRILLPSGLKSTAGKLAPGVDTRGVGGYLVLPPSRHVNATVYRWLNPRVPPAPAPDWIHYALEPVRTATRPDYFGPRAAGWGRAVVGGECDVMRKACDGIRNDTLFACSCRIWEAVNGDHLDEDDAFEAISDAAHSTGLGDAEILRTWRSAEKRVAGRARGPANEGKLAVVEGSLQNLDCAVDTVAIPEEWEDPEPFTDTAAPAFPLEVLPDWCGEFAAAVAEETQTPLDLPAMLSLAGTAAVLQKKAKVVDPWPQPLNLFTAVVLPPGERKSAVFRQVTAPIEALEELLCERTATARLQLKVERDIAEANAKAARVQANKEDTEEARRSAEQALRQLERVEVPVEPRLVVSDVTPERLVELLGQHQGRLAVLDDEGGIFGILAGRYTNGINFDVFLKGWDGGRLTRDRVGRDKPPVTVHEPALTVALAFQPDVLKSIGATQSFRGRGLVGRFLLIVPDTKMGTRKIFPDAVPPEVAKRFGAELVGLEDVSDGGFITLAHDARQLFQEYLAKLEPRLGPYGDLGGIGDWSGKLAGTLLRIMGIVHIARLRDGAFGTPVPADTLARVLRLSDYYIVHFRRAMRIMDPDDEENLAEKAMGWIDRTGNAEVSLRDLYRAVHEAKDDLTKALEVLVERNLVRVERRPAAGGRGGHPSEVVVVNPRWLAREG
jgi:replicative DNA helicase